MAATLADWPVATPSDEPIADLLASLLCRSAVALGSLVRDDAKLVELWNQLDTLSGEAVRVEIGSNVLEGIGARD